MADKFNQPPTTQPDPNQSSGGASGYGGDGGRPPVVGTGMEDQRGDEDQTPAQRLGARLRQARLRLNMSQSETSAQHFSQAYIDAVEQGQIRPSLGALEVLSTRLGVPLEDLLGNPTSQATTEQSDQAQPNTPSDPTDVKENE